MPLNERRSRRKVIPNTFTTPGVRVACILVHGVGIVLLEGSDVAAAEPTLG